MHALLRFDVCLVIFLVTMVWEYRYPRRALVRPRHERWLTNLSLTTLNALLVWGTVGGIAYTTALFAVGKEMELLHWVSVPPWVAAIVTFLVLDFAIYLQHVLFHAVPLLWRFHRVHHADLGFDATTGLRFHPVEIFLSLGLKSTIVLVLGATPWAVFAFEVALNVSSVFNHGNVAIPKRWDRWLRRFIVTPDMHRIHHSTQVAETNSNFGFSVSWWDRVCGTYRAEPALGQERMEIGVRDYLNPLNLGELLILPFRSEAGQYPFTGVHPTHT